MYRETREENDLLFLCFLIQSLSRMTHQTVNDIVAILGEDALRHYFSLADVYHCENPDDLFPRLIEKHAIPMGTFDNITPCRYRIPTPMDIAKVYRRLILAVARHTSSTDLIATLIHVYSSPFTQYIENYNSSVYFENPEYVFLSFLEGSPLLD